MKTTEIINFIVILLHTSVGVLFDDLTDLLAALVCLLHVSKEFVNLNQSPTGLIQFPENILKQLYHFTNYTKQ